VERELERTHTSQNDVGWTNAGAVDRRAKKKGRLKEAGVKMGVTSFQAM